MDGQAQVRLVFAGELLEGHSLEQVKRLFGEMFKLEGDRLAAVFSGKRTVLKREIGREDGERYVARLRKLGMQVLVEPLDDGLPGLKPLPAAAGAAPAPALQPMAAPAATLALQELAEEVQCPNCGERQPKKFVLCRKCTTDIPRALAAKAEDAERARAERLAARQEASGRYAPPGADVEGGYSGGEVDPPPFASLSLEGRYGRATYVNTWGVAMLAIMVAGVVSAVLVPLLGMLVIVPMGLAGLAMLVWGIRVNVLRLHDFNRSGWWLLLTLIPYLGVLVNIVLALWPGHAEENDYGPKPKRGNMVLAIAIIVLSFVGVGVMAAVALPAYQGYVKRAKQKAEQGQPRPAEEGQEQAPAQEQSMPRLPTGPAEQVYRDQYLPASNEKAFAVSSAGAYGWASGKMSAREAVSAALSDCDTRREAYTGQCRIVSVNGLIPKER
jgi:uncharacterized membrane protein YhaH (DUF805 family)/Tfp pilus assembly major pilin PilA